MTTEPIDLASVKSLIDNVWKLKKQVQTLTKKWEVAENDRDHMATQLSTKERLFQDEVRHLKKTHNTAIENQKKVAAQEKKSLIDEYENKLQKAISELERKNITLYESKEKLSQENHAIINRIRGIEP